MPFAKVAALSILLLCPAVAQAQFGVPAGVEEPPDPSVSAGEERPLALRGRLFIDGVPARDKVVEIRLETEGGVQLATAYNLASEEFEFRGVTVNPNDDHVLVIREPGLVELRQPIELGRDFLGTGMTELGLRVPNVFLYLVSDSSADGVGSPATVDVTELLNSVPDTALDLYRAAMEQDRAGDARNAIDNLVRALEIAPNFYEALNLLGSKYIETGRYSEALVPLSRAYEINKNDPVPLLNLGVLYFSQGQAAEAVAVGNSDRAPEDLLADAHASYIEAIDYLEEASRLDPSSPQIALYLGSALYEAGSHDRAEELLTEAVGRDRSLDGARLVLINIYVRQQRHPEALEQVELYLDAHPDTPQRLSLERARDMFRALLGTAR